MTHLTTTPTVEAVRQQWNAAAEGWDSQSPLLRAWLADATQTMFDQAGIAPGHAVLDVAAGAGEQTQRLAQRLGPTGRVVATDLSPELIERLRRHLANTPGAQVRALAMDAQLPWPQCEVFDAAICRLGLMLMPEPDRCLVSVRDALKPGARLSAMVFAEPEANPALLRVMQVALRHAGVAPPDPFAAGGLFSLGRPGELERRFVAAGFGEVSDCRVEARFRAPSVDGYVRFLRSAAAPVIALLSRLPRAAQEAAWAEVREQLRVFEGPEAWVGPNTLLITSGRK